MKNFCVVPWYSREIDLAKGSESVCCWLTGNPDINELKKDILADKQSVACGKCWNNEAKGIESRRQMENRFLDYALDRDLTSIADDVRRGKSKPVLYQFFLGSLCNSTCVTCGPGASTAWQALKNIQSSIKIESASVDGNADAVESTIDWSSIKRINLLGGEPLLIKKSLDILDRLKSAKNINCLISFVTNGSVKLNNNQLELLKDFSNTQCCVSIDGLGKMFEYIRYPLKWDTLLQNLEQYKKVFNEVVVSFTVSNLNYHARDEIVAWFKKHDLLYIENFVTFPAYFDHRVQPGHGLWGEFVKNIKLQDRLKGISIDDYIPAIGKDIH